LFLLINKSFFQRCRTIPAKWRRRGSEEKKLLLEAFFLLGIARFFVLTIPFRWLAKSLGAHWKETGNEISEYKLRQARLVGAAVRSSANYTPWESVCLPQAVAAKWMLRRLRIPGTVYLGVMKDEKIPEKLAAHAWLRCGPVIITGAKGHRQFTVVSTFS
jgi:hypothetical protein